MRVIADTHVHLYDEYPLGPALRCLHSSLARLAEDAALVGLLTSRNGVAPFSVLEKLSDSEISIARPSSLVRRLSFSTAPRELFLIAGRQIVTREGIEVLALCTDAAVPDGNAARDTILAVLAAGGVPVLSWSPLKWIKTGRSAVVRSLFDSFAPDVLIGDTTLRPTRFPLSALVKYGHAVGARMIAGTDALPLAGEERRLGTYATLWETDLNLDDPVTTLRQLLTDRHPSGLPGKRRNAFMVARWILRSQTGL